MVLMAFSLLFNIFGTDGRVLVKVWKLKITYEGLIQAAYMLTDGLEKSMRFLNVIKFPVHEIAMMMSIALRFIPILVEEADKIMKAQQARGADFDNGGIFKKTKALVPLLIPLFVSAIRRAYDLATAMETRCYRGGKGRTKMKPLKYTGKDFVAYAILLVYLVIIIAAKILWNYFLR